MNLRLVYMLDEDNKPHAVDDYLEWAKWMAASEKQRRVAQNRRGSVWVSTVFLGVDHRHFGQGAPVLFETMVFGGALNHWQRRYCTWEEAKGGHRLALDVVTSITRTGNERLADKLRSSQNDNPLPRRDT